MRRLLVSLPDELHEDLRELAFRRKTNMSKLVRAAIESTYEDEIDQIESEKGLEDFLSDPKRGISVEEYIAKRRIAVRS